MQHRGEFSHFSDVVLRRFVRTHYWYNLLGPPECSSSELLAHLLPGQYSRGLACRIGRHYRHQVLVHHLRFLGAAMSQLGL